MPTEAGAPNPILAIVEGDAGARIALERVIARRFDGDYTITTAASGEEAAAVGDGASTIAQVHEYLSAG